MKWVCKNCKPAKPCVLTYDNVRTVKMPDTCPFRFITPSSGKNWEKIEQEGGR